ncbi:MAG: hypothetical protein K1060chlam5_00413, partial [Candidatus Anoxychlamydiales bacterium]|nr:hypothetical protein [Candidatus Anoxychlamydiales bacterium]
MKKNNHPLIYYFTVWSLIIFFITISTSIILFQTSYGKNKIKNYFLYFAKQNNIELKIEKLSGLIPFEYKLDNVNVKYNEYSMHIDKVKFRIEFWPILTKDLVFKKFIASNITYDKTSSNNKEIKSLSKNNKDWITPILDINFKKIKLLDFNTKINETLVVLNFNGDLKINKDGKEICSNFNVYRKDFLDTTLNFKACATKENKMVDLSLLLDSKNLQAFRPFIFKNLDSSFEIYLTAKGKIDTFLSYFNNNPKNLSPINGKIELDINKLKSDNKTLDFIISRQTSFDIKFTTDKDLKIHLYKGKVQNDLISMFIDSTIDKKFNFLNSNLILKIDNLSKLNEISPLPLTGILKSTIEQNNSNFKSNINIDEFHILNTHFRNFDLNSNFTYKNDVVNGAFKASTFAFNQPFEISSNYSIKDYFFDFQNIYGFAPSSKLNGDLKITANLILLGNLSMHFDDLSQIRVFYPKMDFNANSDLKVNFHQFVEDEKSYQKADLNLKISDFYISNIFGKKLEAHIEILDPFKEKKIKTEILANDLSLHDLSLTSLKINFSTFLENHPFSIDAIGELKKPLTLKTRGFFDFKNGLEFDIQEIYGNAFSYPFSMPKPTKLVISNSLFQLDDFTLDMQEAKVFANIDLNKNKSLIDIDITHLPIDFLSLNKLDLDVSGFISSKINLQKNNFLNGKISLDVEDFKITSLLDEKPLLAKGNLIAEIDNSIVTMQSNLFVKNIKMINLNASLPLNINFFPLNIEINKNKNLLVDAEYNGKVEELLDFINIGPQRLEGDLNSQVTLSNKITDLKVNGYIHFKNGTYENYYLGTYLKDINATFLANKNNLTLKFLHAVDNKNGQVNA